MKKNLAKLLFSISIIFAGKDLHAQNDALTLRRYIVDLIPYAAIDFPERRGSIAAQNGDQVIYQASVPYHFLYSNVQNISTSQKTGQAFYTAVYTGDKVALAEKTITGFGTDGLDSGYPFDQPSYTANSSAKKTPTDIGQTLFILKTCQS